MYNSECNRIYRVSSICELKNVNDYVTLKLIDFVKVPNPNN